MHAQNFLVNKCGNRKAVKAVSKRLPNSNVVPSLALIIEAIDSVDRGALVVSSQEEEVLRVLDLVREQKANSFERLFASVDVVAEEEVVGIWGESSVLEESQQVEELTMYISADLDRGFKFQ